MEAEVGDHICVLFSIGHKGSSTSSLVGSWHVLATGRHGNILLALHISAIHSTICNCFIEIRLEALMQWLGRSVI